MKFEYVFSGLNMSRVHYAPFVALPENVAVVQSSLDQINEVKPYFVSGMFNAFYEAGRSEVMGKHYRNHFHNIHSDSGGLQIITRGMKITPELKLQVYNTQGQHSDIAMCFDDIPLHVIDSANESSRTNISNKLYVSDDMNDAAKSTGKNINDQLNAFAAMNSDTKVMMIIQGNNRYDMARWGEVAFNEVDDELKDKVYGIALADTCMGNGILETVEMCASVPLMNIPERIKKNIHLLGVGSIARLIPIIELSRTEMFSDCNISFDSSSHSQTMVKGKYVNEKGKGVDIGRVLNKSNTKLFKLVYDQISAHYSHSVSFDDYLKFVSDNITTTKHLNGDNDHVLTIMGNLTYWFVPLISARHFMDNIVHCQNDPSYYHKILNKNSLKTIRPLMQLANIKSNECFDEWFKMYAKYVPSNRIERIDGSIEDRGIITLF